MYYCLIIYVFPNEWVCRNFKIFDYWFGINLKLNYLNKITMLNYFCFFCLLSDKRFVSTHFLRFEFFNSAIRVKLV